MTDPVDGPPQQPVPNQPGRGPLDDPAGHEYRRPITDPVPGPNVSETAGLAQTAAPASDPAVSAPSTHPAPGFDERGKVKSGRVSGVWVGLIGTAIFLILLIIFVAQNSRKVTIHFLGADGQFSLALTILLSAVIGVLLVAIPGSVRILQLRRALRRNGPGQS